MITAVNAYITGDIIVSMSHLKRLAEGLVFPLFMPPNNESTVLAAEEIEDVEEEEKEGTDGLKLKLEFCIAGSIIFKTIGKNI